MCNKIFENLSQCNHRPMEFSTADLHHSAYASVLASTHHHTPTYQLARIIHLHT